MSRMRQYKIGLPQEVADQIATAAKDRGCTFSEEARARIEAFCEGNRLVTTTVRVHASRLPKLNQFLDGDA